MPFFEVISPLRKSGKEQKNKNSLSVKNTITTGLHSPDNEAAHTEKKGILLHLAKASITLEAALIIPLFFMTVICIASISGIYSETLDKMVSLRDSAESAAVAAGISDDEIWIELPGTVEFTPWFLPSAIASVKVSCSGSVRAWVGRDKEAAVSAGEESYAEYVYVTETGEVYHTDSACSHIDLSVSAVSSSEVGALRNESGGKYHECERCESYSDASGTVYITKYGDRYHVSSACSGLKRTVRLVDISTLDGMRECSKCASKSA